MKRRGCLLRSWDDRLRSVAKQAKEVRGMDTVPQAIADAKKCGKIRISRNTRYEVGTAEILEFRLNG